MGAGVISDPGVLLGAALLVAGAILAGLADRARLPAMLLFLGLGMLVGDDGLAWVRFDDPVVAQHAGVVALIVILYAGGLGTKPSDLRHAALPGLLLATVGVAITAAVVAGGTLLLLDVEPLTAALTGAVVASTDAAAVFAMLRNAPLPRRLRALLEIESGANDPIAILLTVGLLEAFRSGASAGDWLLFGLLQLGGGLAVGGLAGLAGVLALTRLELSTTSLYPVLALGVAGLSYGLAAAAGASGFLAAYVTGIVVGTRAARHRRAVRSFHDGLANAAEIGLFLVLGLLVFPSQLPAAAVPALAVTAVLVFLARPLAVAACLTPLGWGLREQALVGWAGLRGAVPIVLATFPLTAGHPQGETIFNVTFFAVLVSTALQGSTIGPVAGWLGLRERTPYWATVAEALPLEGMDADLVEVHVRDGLAIAGRSPAEAPPPPGAHLLALVRGTQVLLPTGGIRFQPGDHVLLAAPRRPEATAAVVAWARGEPSPPGPGGEQPRQAAD